MTFPNQLAQPKPLRWPLTSAGGKLTLLLVLCLLPRGFMAWRMETLSPDGATYIEKALAVQNGELRGPVSSHDFNVYPLVLAALHRAGLDWETAAKLWGVLAGGLAVLPLFGWVRRMFDDRVALLAGLLYAAHPKLIEWSPEALRDPTFWLLLTCSLYGLWRAVTEVRLAWFAMGGVAAFLAVNTRFEGWFLLLPLLLWSLWRLIALREGRRRVLGGLTVFALCYPLVLAFVVYCHGYERWDWGAWGRVRLVQQFVLAKWEALQQAGLVAEGTHSHASAPEPDSLNDVLAAAAPSQEGSAGRSPLTPGQALAAGAAREIVAVGKIVLDKWGRAFTPLFGLLALVGFCKWWRLWLRRDHFPLLLFAGATLGAMWIHASLARDSSTRYVLPLVILATPMAALGLLRACKWAARMAATAASRRWAAQRRTAPHLAATATLLLVLATGVGAALTSRVSGNVAKEELGRWMLRQGGPGQVIIGSANWTVVAFHARGEYVGLSHTDVSPTLPDEFQRLLRDKSPDYVVLCRPKLKADQLSDFVLRAEACGLEPVAAQELPPPCRDRVVVLRRKTAPEVATIPADQRK
jgi:hypothetical protein